MKSRNDLYAEIEQLEQLVADLAESVEQAVDDVEEAREIARDMWHALVALRRAWVNEEDMISAWNRIYVLELPEYLRSWLRDTS